MNLTQLYTVGDNQILLKGVVGQLEAMIMCPENYRTDYIAILGHPHSLQGGTMQNKVVTTLARTFRDLGIPSIRFNFRGVGASAGEYDAGVGESEDMLAIISQLKNLLPDVMICLAGFSFGSYVTFRAAQQTTPALLISIAPPVTHCEFNNFSFAPWIIVQGDEDEVIAASAVYQWAQQLTPPPILITFHDATHFFHGKLNDLRLNLSEKITQALNLT